MSTIKILTHSGPAHLDELMAISALIVANDYSLDDVEVTRSFDSSGDLSIYDYVVDIGRVFDGVSRFDHHQGGSDVADKSSFGLVVDSLEQLKSLRGNAFVERVDFQDNNGPKATLSTYLNSDANLASWFNSFELFEQLVLSEFSSGNIRFALEVATKVVSTELDIVNAKAEAEANMEMAEVVVVEGLRVLTTDFDIIKDPKFFTIGNVVSSEVALEKDCVLILGKNRDPGQYALIRTQKGQDAGLDLSVLEGVVPFAHKGGFMASISRESDWKAIVAKLS